MVERVSLAECSRSQFTWHPLQCDQRKCIEKAMERVVAKETESSEKCFQFAKFQKAIQTTEVTKGSKNWDCFRRWDSYTSDIAVAKVPPGARVLLSAAY